MSKECIDNARLVRVKVDHCVVSPWNPRKHVGEEELAELSEALVAEGQIVPILVIPAQGSNGAPTWEVLAGQRRVLAARRAGQEEVLAMVADGLGADQVAFRAVTENLQREGLRPVEEGRAFAAIAEEFGLSDAEVAARIGKAPSYVSRRCGLLRLSGRLQAAALEGAISTRTAEELAQMPEDLQEQAGGAILAGNASGDEAARIVHAFRRQVEAREFLAGAEEQGEAVLENCEGVLDARGQVVPGAPWVDLAAQPEAVLLDRYATKVPAWEGCLRAAKAALVGPLQAHRCVGARWQCVRLVRLDAAVEACRRLEWFARSAKSYDRAMEDDRFRKEALERRLAREVRVRVWDWVEARAGLSCLGREYLVALVMGCPAAAEVAGLDLKGARRAAKL